MGKHRVVFYGSEWVSGLCLGLVSMLLLMTGCGEESTPDADGQQSPIDLTEVDAGPQDCFEIEGPNKVSGYFYVDEDRSDQSMYTGGPAEVDQTFKGDLRVLGAPDDLEISRCEDGSYTIGGLVEGAYLVQPLLEPGSNCTTNNCSSRFANALAETGTAVVVTFGDSVAVIGEPPMFPARFASLMEGIGSIDNRNVAVGGTTSRNWLPTSQYYTSRLAPHLVDADLILITLGGNDIMEFVSGRVNDIGALLADIPGAIEDAKDAVRLAVANIMQTIEAIRQVNPTVDIAYCLYPNYSQAEDSIWGTISGFLGPDAVSDVLEEARVAFPGDQPNLQFVDLFGAAEGLPLSDYLLLRNGQLDPLHFNARGQVLYAEEVFKTLGGILIGPSPLGEFSTTPLGLTRNYGLAPSE